jgi:hypothetical protein
VASPITYPFSTTGPTQSPTAIATDNPPSTENASSLSAGAIGAIVGGVLGGVIIIVTILGLIYLQTQRDRRLASVTNTPETINPYSNTADNRIKGESEVAVINTIPNGRLRREAHDENDISPSGRLRYE